MASPGVESLTALLHHAEAGGAPAGLASWFRDGLAAFGAGDPLEVALGLDGAGGTRRAVTRWRLARRDHALCLAWGDLTRPGQSANATALALLSEIRRFESGEWLRIRHLPEPPADLTAVRRHLFDALQTGAPLPRMRRLIDLCSKSLVQVASVGADPKPTDQPDHDRQPMFDQTSKSAPFKRLTEEDVDAAAAERRAEWLREFKADAALSARYRGDFAAFYKARRRRLAAELMVGTRAHR